MKQPLLALCLAACTLSMVGCPSKPTTEPTTRQAWRAVFDACMESDLIENEAYFGPSSRFGPGTVFRLEDGVYKPRWLVEDLPTENPIVLHGEAVSCEAMTRRDLDASLDLVFNSVVSAIDARFRSVVQRASVEAIHVEAFSIDTIHEGRFLRAVRAMPKDNDYVRDLSRDDIVLVGAAVRVTGFEAAIILSNESIAQLEADGGSLEHGITVGGGFFIKKTGSDTVLSSSTQPFYVFGNFSSLDRDFEQAGTAQVAEGTLDAADPILNSGHMRDRYRLTMRSGETRQITLLSTDFDGVLTIVSPTGNVIGTDDGAGDEPETLTLRADDAGEYQVLVSSYATGDTGNYRLIMQPTELADVLRDTEGNGLLRPVDIQEIQIDASATNNAQSVRFAPATDDE